MISTKLFFLICLHLFYVQEIKTYHDLSYSHHKHEMPEPEDKQISLTIMSQGDDDNLIKSQLESEEAHAGNDKKIVNETNDDADDDDEDVEDDLKSIDSLVDEAARMLNIIVANINSQIQELNSLKEQSSLKAEKSLEEAEREIDNRILYVKSMIHKKHEEARLTGTNIVRCVTDTDTRLKGIPSNLKDELHQCIQTEMDATFDVVSSTITILRKNVNKIATYQDRLNRCIAMQSKRKMCLIHIIADLVKFKKYIVITVSTKVMETIAYLTGIPLRLQSCNSTQMGKVVTNAGEIILNFNRCIAISSSKKRDSDLLLFLV